MKKVIAVLVALCGFLAQANAQTQPASAPARQFRPRLTCTRQSLQQAVDSYLAAQKSGDRTRMALAEKVTYLAACRT